MTIGEVHSTLTNIIGPASSYPCISCHKQARDWAYQHTGETLRAPGGQAYSIDVADYAPMCRSCHNQMDRRLQPHIQEAMNAGIREWAEREHYNIAARYRALGHANKGKPHCAVNAASARKALEEKRKDPEFVARLASTRKSAHQQLRVCARCGKESTTFGIGNHQKWSGHVGYWSRSRAEDDFDSVVGGGEDPWTGGDFNNDIL